MQALLMTLALASSALISLGAQAQINPSSSSNSAKEKNLNSLSSWADKRKQERVNGAQGSVQTPVAAPKAPLARQPAAAPKNNPPGYTSPRHMDELNAWTNKRRQEAAKNQPQQGAAKAPAPSAGAKVGQQQPQQPKVRTQRIFVHQLTKP
jgi:hypothetical protein